MQLLIEQSYIFKMGAIQCCQQPIMQSSFTFRSENNLQSRIPQLIISQAEDELQNKKNLISSKIGIQINSISYLNEQTKQIPSQIKSNNKIELKHQQKDLLIAINGQIIQSCFNQKQMILKKLFQIKKSQFKNLSALKINTLKIPQNQISKTYYLRFNRSFYIGEWKYHSKLKSDIPFGIGRLFKNQQLYQGTLKTSVKFQTCQEYLHSEQQHIQKSFPSRKQSFLKEKNIKQNVLIQMYLDGIGRHITAKGQQYNGQFSKDKLNGKGFYKNLNIDYFCEGNWLNGLREGKGTQKTKLTFYDGGYKDDKKNGKGVLIFYLSHKCEQERLQQEKKLNKIYDKYQQEQDKAQLKKKIQKLKNIYFLIDTQFKKEKEKNYKQKVPIQKLIEPWEFPSVCQNQNFIYQHQSKKLFLQKYVGDFKNDIIDSNGSYQWSNGKYYNGEWKQGQMQGVGQLYFPHGVLYKGQFKNDKRHGKGQTIINLSEIYRGSWAFDLKHGYGQTFQYKEVNQPQGTISKKLVVKGSKWNKNKEQKLYFCIQIQDLSFKEQLPANENKKEDQFGILNPFIKQNKNEHQQNIFEIDEDQNKSQYLKFN